MNQRQMACSSWSVLETLLDEGMDRPKNWTSTKYPNYF